MSVMDVLRKKKIFLISPTTVVPDTALIIPIGLSTNQKSMNISRRPRYIIVTHSNMDNSSSPFRVCGLCTRL